MCCVQGQGEEDRAGGAVHLPAGPSHPQHQGRALHPDHHPTEAGQTNLLIFLFLLVLILWSQTRSKLTFRSVFNVHASKKNAC